MSQPDLASKPNAVAAKPCRRTQLAIFLRDHFGWMLSIFLIGLGAKLWLIKRCGTPLPFWDQWYGEAEFLYVPYFEGRLSLPLLFRAHNEHRIFFTRIYDLVLLLLNGQWDNQLQMVVNAIFHSALLAGFGGLLARLIGKAIWPFIWPPLILALVLPFAWENTLWGFQSQFYFLIFFSLATIWLLGLNRPFSPKWWLGAIVAVGSLFTTASGFLGSDAVLAIVLLDILKHRGGWRQNSPTIALCLTMTIAGFLLKSDVPIHHVLQAHSFSEFAISLGNSLAWPWIVLPFYAPCNLFPLLLLGWFYWRSKGELPAERLVLGIGFWVSAQAAAAAYGRGAGGSPPSWRYMDLTSFTMIANCAAIGLLLLRYRNRLWPGKLWGAGFAIWAISCLTGAALLANRAWQIDIPESQFYARMQLKTTRDFLATDDPRPLYQKPRPYILMPSNVTNEVALLRNRYIRNVLPAIVRAPMHIIMQENGNTNSTNRDCFPALKDQAPEPVWGFCPATGSNAPRSLESLPIEKPNLPYLEFPVAGELDAPGLSLDLVNLENGRKTTIHPGQIPSAQWASVDVRAPDGDFKIVARDESPASWFVFQQPRELGGLSFRAIQILCAWKIILAGGIVCSVSNMAWQIAQWRGRE